MFGSFKMNTVIGFRKAKPQDANFLLKLRIAAMHQHLVKAGIVMTEAQHRMRVSEFYFDSQLILKKQTPMGLIKIGVLSESLHIRQFQIVPKFQGFGIGSMVLELLKKKAISLCLPITLNVLENNPAKNLYLRKGFQVENSNQLESRMIWNNPMTNKKN